MWTRKPPKRGQEPWYRRSLTAKTLASQWIPVYPGTDAVLMTAILYTLIVKKLVNYPFINKYCTGFNELQCYILGDIDGVPKTPSWAAAICGVHSTLIEALATRYGETHPVALIPGASIQRTLGGEEAIRMAVALQTATGNIGVLGGSPGALAFGTLPRPNVGVIPIPKTQLKSRFQYIDGPMWFSRENTEDSQ